MRLTLDPIADHILATVRTPRSDGFVPPEQRPDVRFGRFLADGTPRISPSQVNTLRMCPARWKHQYLDGMPDRGSFQAVAGSIAHAAMEAALATIDDPVGPRALEASTRFAAEVHLSDTATLAATSNGAGIDTLALAGRIGTAVRSMWDWLLFHDVEVLGIEERTIGRYHAGIEVASLSYVDARLRIDGETRIIDWKFPGRAPWRSSGVVEARDPHRRAMQMYGDAYHQAGTHIEEAWIVHAPLDGSDVAVAKETLTHETRAQSRDQVHAAITRILQGDLDADPVTPGALCSRTWCAFYGQCPAVA